MYTIELKRPIRAPRNKARDPRIINPKEKLFFMIVLFVFYIHPTSIIEFSIFVWIKTSLINFI